MHALLETWPAPELICNVAKFICFLQFYLRFIHHFELHITLLREICRNEYTAPVAPHWMDSAQAALDDMKNAIISNTCLQWFGYRKLVVF